MFTTSKPVIFAYHGYPTLIHRLAYRRTNHANFHVHGFQEEGTTTTPFDMAVINGIDRFHLAQAAVDRVPALAPRRAEFHDFVASKLALHDAYIREHGEDMPEIRDWKWQAS
jgi:xylulose-5-phosphate/fructose-6-phosphate phosphoketolase